jgi:hypothetical protein
MTDNDDDLYQDLDSKSINSGWDRKRNVIQSRKKGWIRRLKTEINSGKVDALSTVRETEQQCIFPPIRVDLKKPARPKMEYISNLGFDSDLLSQSVLCMVCFSYVSIGNERVVCQHCPIVIHCSCIKNPLDYTSNKGVRGLPADYVPTSYDITWTCAFCIHDVKKKNHDALQVYKRAVVAHAFKSAVVKVQSFFRMYPKKIEFAKQVKSALILQRLHRNRHFRVAVMKERLAERRAVRVRVHATLVSSRISCRNAGTSRYHPMKLSPHREGQVATGRHTESSRWLQ